MLVAILVYGIVLLGVLGVEIPGEIGWSLVVVATMVWLASMTGYFGWRYRALLRDLEEGSESGDERPM